MFDSNIVRIFVSSTFSDFEKERNALQTNVFPKLQELCMQHGMQFQAVDLRWGVSEDDAQSQQTMEICIEELKRCKEVSPRPNFLFLLGNRYGWQPLPSKIPQKEFKELASNLNGESLSLLEYWYMEDSNANSPIYVLRTRGKAWEETEKKLRFILREAINRADWPEDDLRRIKYEASATQQEFIKGVLEDQQAQNHVLGVIRRIHGFPENNQSQTLSNFIDVDKVSGMVDKDAQYKLKRMKNQIQKMIPNNILSYDTTWTEIGPKLDFIDQMCSEVYEHFSQLILSRIEERKTKLPSNPVEMEMEENSRYVESQVEDFIGREKDLEAIQRYISEKRSYPFVVCGLSGIGKSALLAYASDLLKKRYPNAVTIRRFIGVTPASFEVKSLTESICQELNLAFSIQDNHKQEEDNPMDWKEWIMELQKKLSLASKERPIILLIDAINQLTNREQAIQFIKHFTNLHPHLHFIVSITPEFESVITESLPISALYPMGEVFEEGEVLLDKLLAKANRSLQPEQKSYVIQQYYQCPRPLYLKLIFQQVVKWRSWDLPQKMAQKRVPSIQSAMDELLDKLERKYGFMLISRSLSYLASSRYGLTEQEWYTIVSKDLKILEEFRFRNPDSPDVEALPMNIFSRLYWEIYPYITGRLKEINYLITFFHSYFPTVIEERYLLNDDLRWDIREEIIAYFHSSPTSLRKIDEYPWQLLKQKSWEPLSDLLADEDFMIPAWGKDNEDIRRYWSEIERNSSIRKQDVYKDLMVHPEAYKYRFLEACSQLYFYTSSFTEALDLFEVLQGMDEATKEKQAEYISVQADILYKVGDNLNKALELYQMAEKIGEECGDDLRVSFSKNGQARIYRDRKDLQKALVLYKEAEDICREHGEKDGVASCLNNRAVVYNMQGDSAKALALYEEAEAISKETGRLSGIPLYINHRGIIYEERGEFDKALALYEEAEGMARAIGDREIVSRSISNQAYAYKGKGALYKAIEKFEEAKEIAKEIGYGELYSQYVNNQAFAYEDLGDIPKAIELFDEALTIAKEFGRVEPQIKYLKNVYPLYENLEEWEKVLNYLKDLEFIYSQEKNYKKEIKWCMQEQQRIRQKMLSQAQAEIPKIERNAPCTCGSGKKFKKCCGK